MNFLVGTVVIIYGILVIAILSKDLNAKPIFSYKVDKLIITPVALLTAFMGGYLFFYVATKIGEAIL